MRKVFKALSLLFSFVCAAVFAFIVTGDINIPNEIITASGQSLYFGNVYTLLRAKAETGVRCVDAVEQGNEESYTVTVKILNIFPVKNSKVTVTQREYVVPGGNVFGIRLYTDGVVVVGTDEVMTAGGCVNPARESGLKKGDIITAVNGKKVNRNQEISEAFEKSGGKPLMLSVIRDGKKLDVIFSTALCKADGKYRAGIWVRDSSAGIGTMAFYNKETGIFGGLGHAVCDVDTGEIMPLSGGDAVKAAIKGYYKGSSGNPGELCGVFEDGKIGTLLMNGDTGIYGKLDKIDKKAEIVPVALRNEIKTGYAQMLSTIDDKGPRYYDIEITKIYSDTDSHSKNMIIEVTDEDLIAATGGIVQGMSGSPIIQNGMFAGAVTHVFINNPLQGYAIFADTMLETAGLASNNTEKLAS